MSSPTRHRRNASAGCRVNWASITATGATSLAVAFALSSASSGCSLNVLVRKHSSATCAIASLKKILLPPQLPILLAEPVDFLPIGCGEKALDLETSLTLIHADLTDPAGQSAGGKAQLLGHAVAGEALLKAVLNSHLLQLRREPGSGPGGVDLR